MYEAKMPLVDFYRASLDSAYQSGFEVVICLIAREADSPDVYEHIEQSWSSLHDLTGQEVLFLFAGDISNHKRLKSEAYHRKGGVEFSSNAMAIASRQSLNFDLPRPWDEFGGSSPYLEDGAKLRQSHTLQISSLRKYLQIEERSVPCLHITFLKSGSVMTIPLSLLSDLSVYQFLKRIISRWEPTFSEQERLKSKIQRERSKVSKLENMRWVKQFNRGISSITELMQSNAYKEVETATTKMLAILNSDVITDENRHEYYRLLAAARDVIRRNTEKETDFIKMLRRLMDYRLNIQKRDLIVSDFEKQTENAKQALTRYQSELAAKQQILVQQLQEERDWLIPNTLLSVTKSLDDGNHSQAIHLHRLICQSFTLEELRTMCFELNVTYDELGGEGLSAKTRELILLMQREHGTLEEVATYIANHRPHLENIK